MTERPRGALGENIGQARTRHRGKTEASGDHDEFGGAAAEDEGRQQIDAQRHGPGGHRAQDLPVRNGGDRSPAGRVRFSPRQEPVEAAAQRDHSEDEVENRPDDQRDHHGRQDRCIDVEHAAQVAAVERELHEDEGLDADERISADQCRRRRADRAGPDPAALLVAQSRPGALVEAGHGRAVPADALHQRDTPDTPGEITAGHAPSSIRDSHLTVEDAQPVPMVRAQTCRPASISRVMVILSPTTTPPPSRGISMSMPKSLRLMTVVASKPATGPAPMPGFTPLNSSLSSTGRVTPLSVKSPVRDVVVAVGTDAGAGEGGRRVGLGVKEVGAADVVVALLVTGVDGVDGDLGADRRGAVLRDGDRAGEVLELAAHLADHEVLDPEADGRVHRVDGPGAGLNRGGHGGGGHWGSSYRFRMVHWA